MDLRSLINVINEAEAPLPGAGQKGPTVAAAAGQDPSNPLNKTSGQAAQPEAPAAEWKPNPEQEKWLGGADRQDPYIMSRMPGDKPPVSYFKDPADQATAKQLGFPAAAKAAATSGQGQQPAKAATTQQKIEKLDQLLVQLAKTRSSAPQTTQVKPADSKPTNTDTGQATQPKAAPAPTSGSTAHKIDQNSDGSYTIHKKDGTTVRISPEGKVLDESALAEALVSSFGYELNEADLSGKQWAAAGAAGATKAGLGALGAKTASKVIPGVGTALSAMDAWNRWQAGDRSGAVIAALAAVGWLIPGVGGWVVGGGLDAANIGRDIAGGSDAAEKKAAQEKLAKQGDPKIIALQKFLKGQGADLGTSGPNKDGVDGVIGPKTREAMDKLELSESQRAQLDQILDEALAPFVQGAKELGGAALRKVGQAAKQFGQGTLSPNVTPIADLSRLAGLKNVKLTQPNAAFKAGQAVGRNPIKSTAAAAGVGGYLGGKHGGDDTGPTASADANGATASVGNTVASTNQSDATTTSTTRSSSQATQPVKFTPEQQQLMQQIKDTLTDLQLSAPNDPAVAKAFGNAKQTLELFIPQK